MSSLQHVRETLRRALLCSPTAHGFGAVLWLECADWWNPIMDEPLRIENGMVIVEDVVGTGVEWDEKAVARFSI